MICQEDILHIIFILKLQYSFEIPIHDYNTISLQGKSISDPKSGTKKEKNHTIILLKK